MHSPCTQSLSLPPHLVGDRRICRFFAQGGEASPRVLPMEPDRALEVWCRVSLEDLAPKKRCKIKQRAEHNQNVCMLFGIYAGIIVELNA